MAKIKSAWHYQDHLLAIIIVASSILIAGLIFIKSAGTLVRTFHLENIFPTFNVKTDALNHTNFLLLGIGGEKHSGNNLTDTIIIASLDQNTHYTTLTSIPRDLFVGSEVGKTKINNIFEFAIEKYGDEKKAIASLQKVIEQVTGIPIHYYVKVDFQGFVEGVDALGGIDVVLEKPFLDNAFPKGETFHYETFYLPAGKVHLDGKTTLKFVRSRHTTSDFSRSKRQHLVLNLIKEKALRIGFLANPINLQKLYQSLSKNFSTNLSWDEIIALTRLAKDFPSGRLLSQMIHDDPGQTGGFLYVPDRRYFANAYVLIPYNSTYRTLDNYEEIRNFLKIFNYHPEFFAKPLQFEIYNGTKKNGFASYTARFLNRYGFQITNFTNAKTKNLAATKIYLKNPEISKKTFETIQKFIPGVIEIKLPADYQGSSADIIIELGQDYLQYFNANSKYFY